MKVPDFCLLSDKNEIINTKDQQPTIKYQRVKTTNYQPATND